LLENYNDVIVTDIPISFTQFGNSMIDSQATAIEYLTGVMMMTMMMMILPEQPITTK